MSNQTKQRIQQAIAQFQSGDLRAHSLRLLATLGYQSERQLALDPAPAAFLATFDTGNFRPDRALFDQWTAVHLLCQITDADIRQANQLILLDSAGKTIDNATIRWQAAAALRKIGGRRWRGCCKRSSPTRRIRPPERRRRNCWPRCRNQAHHGTGETGGASRFLSANTSSPACLAPLHGRHNWARRRGGGGFCAS